MNHGLKEYFPEELPAHELVVKITDADELFAALERRARIAERALRLMQVNNRVIGTIDNYISAAEREIDAEIAQEGR